MPKQASQELHNLWTRTFDRVKEIHGSNLAFTYSDRAIKHFQENGSKDWGPSYEYGIKLMQEKLDWYDPVPMIEPDFSLEEIDQAQTLMEELQ